MNQPVISLKQLAIELSVDRSFFSKYVRKLGVHPKKRRTHDSNGQLALTVTHEEAELIRQKRKEHGYLCSLKPIDNEHGFFYAIQVIPEFAPHRIKLGFAEDVQQRLLQHRTSAPTASIVKVWPCKRCWEKTIIDALAQVGGALLLNEVYEFDDMQQMIDHADKLFELLGDPLAKVNIAKCSQLSK